MMIKKVSANISTFTKKHNTKTYTIKCVFLILSVCGCYLILLFILDGSPGKRWVEITYVAHTHPKVDIVEDVSKGIPRKGSIKAVDKIINSGDGPVVLNYRFLREFTKGLDPSSTYWTVSAINHFRLNDVPH